MSRQPMESGSEERTAQWQEIEKTVRALKFDPDILNSFLESAAEEFDWNQSVRLSDFLDFIDAWVELQILAIQSLYVQPEKLSEADQFSARYEAFGKELHSKLQN